MSARPVPDGPLPESPQLTGVQGFTLLYQGVNLGQITLSDWDFPNLTGAFIPETAADHPEIRRRVKDYVQFRIEADRLARDTPHSLEEFLNLTEPAFSDLIDSDEWSLVDEQGRRLRILAPTFSPDGRVTWRWRER